MEQQNCKDHQRRGRLLISKMEINYQIPSEIKVLPIDTGFSNWVNFNLKVSIINCSIISESVKAIYFFLRTSKLKAHEKTSPFFSVSLLSLLFSNCYLAMFLNCALKIKVIPIDPAK